MSYVNPEAACVVASGFYDLHQGWVQSNGCKSRVRVDSAKHIARGKGVHREAESEGNRRQTSGLV